MSVSTTMGHMSNNLVIMLCGAYNSLIYQTPRVRTARLFVKLVYLQFKSEAAILKSFTSYSPLTVGKAQTRLSKYWPRYEMDFWGKCVSISGRSKWHFPSLQHPVEFWFPMAFCSTCIGVSFSRGIAPGRKFDNLSPSSFEFQNVCKNTFMHACMHGIVLTSVQETFTFPDGRRWHSRPIYVQYSLAATHLNYCTEDKHNCRSQ
jgi:hypothetical protein